MRNFIQKKANSMTKSAYIFACPDDETLYEITMCVVKVFLCENNGFDNCPTCQKVECGSHPDLLTYPKGEAFSTQDAKDIIENANKKPMLSKNKIILIKDLDNSSVQAQNKLLKILESPPNNVIFLIYTTNINKVLSTVVSRLIKVDVTPFDSKTLRLMFKHYENNENFELAMQSSNGYIGYTKRILIDDNFHKCHLTARNIVTKLKNSASVVDYIIPKISKSQFDDILQNMQSMYRDVAMLKCGKDDLVINRSIISDLKEVQDEFSLKAITKIIKKINDVNKKQFSNVSLSLLFESLLVNILEVKYLCR